MTNLSFSTMSADGRMLEYLETIARNIAPKPSFHVIQSGNKSRLETNFIPSLDFPTECNYEIALISLETYYSFPNVDDENNKLKFSHDNGTSWSLISIPTGCYELKDINAELQKQVIAVGGEDKDVIIEGNENTFQCILILKDNIEVDMTMDHSLRTVLGFKSAIFKKGSHTSEHTVNIMRVNSILVHNDVIGATYLNGTQQPIIFSFFPGVSPGEKIVVQPQTLIYMPLTLGVISRMISWLTDQDGKYLDLREEELTIKYHIRSC